MINEATYKLLNIIYLFILSYLLSNGKGPHATRLVEFLALRDSTSKSMYEVVSGPLEKIYLLPLNQVDVATNGASIMTKHHT